MGGLRCKIWRFEAFILLVFCSYARLSLWTSE